MNAQMATTQPVTGVFYNEPAEVYYRKRLDECNATGMKHMLRSPAHFKHYIEGEDDKDTPAKTFGRMFHCASLEPDVFAKTYVVLPENAPRDLRRFRDAKKPSVETLTSIEWWDKWEADNRGKVMVSRADYDKSQFMGDSVRAHPVAAGLLAGGHREVTMRWADEETGIACKLRADLYEPGEFMMDLKSCMDASEEGFARAIAGYKYDMQGAHYLDGVRANSDRIKWFIFLACESTAPFVCQPYVLNVDAEERGWKLRQKAIKRQAECLRTGQWPGYSDSIKEISLPTWAFYQLGDQ